MLFWSGQSFSTQGLDAEGTFKAAEKRFVALADIDRDLLQSWLGEARVIQWDYKNIVKRRQARAPQVRGDERWLAIDAIAPGSVRRLIIS